MKTFKEISYLRKETSFKDHGYMFFSNIEQKPMIMSTDIVPLVKLSHSSPICGSDATIIEV
jgi:hypothetical protein